LEQISNIIKDIYELEIYDSVITGINPISQQAYENHENIEGKLCPELIESLIEKPGQEDEKRFYVEDIRNCIIFNYSFESFKKDSLSYAIVQGEIVFQIEYRIKEKEIVNIPGEDQIIIRAEKIKEKRAAVVNKPRLSGENLTTSTTSDFIVGIFEILAGAIIIISLLYAFWQIWKYALVVFGIIAIFWLIGFLGRLLFRFVIAILSWISIVLLIAFVSIWFLTRNKVEESKLEKKKYEDICLSDTINIPEDGQNDNTDSISGDSLKSACLYNSLQWTDFQNKQYSFNYKLLVNNFVESRKFRSKLSGNEWNSIYRAMYLNDYKLLSEIYQKYDSLKAGLKSMDFARLIVSSIQEIPYTWILPGSCYDAPNKEQINQSGFRCLGNVLNYGVQSPLEFMANQKGDCDTKTLMLYTILKHFKYDVCILVSTVYEHAMLGINIPASGKFIVFRGIKYYAWETTVKGMDMGQMVPGYSNMEYWEVVL